KSGRSGARLWHSLPGCWRLFWHADLYLDRDLRRPPAGVSVGFHFVPGLDDLRLQQPADRYRRLLDVADDGLRSVIGLWGVFDLLPGVVSDAAAGHGCGLLLQYRPLFGGVFPSDAGVLEF